MDKAGKALRRSSVRLRSAGSGHTDLQLVISEFKEVRNACNWLRIAQTSAADDLLKWALRGESRIVQETMSQLFELNLIWSDVQQEFADGFKDLRQQFTLVLENERRVDAAKTRLGAAEQRELRCHKELEKAKRQSSNQNITELQERLKQAVDARELAHIETTECSKENEAIKLIRLKKSLIQISEAYLAMSHKCRYIFEAQHNIALGLPDVTESDIHQIKYSGSVAATQAVLTAKEKVERYRHSSAPNCVSETVAQPPPYNPHFREHRRSSTCPAELYPARSCSNMQHPMWDQQPYHSPHVFLKGNPFDE